MNKLEKFTESYNFNDYEEILDQIIETINFGVNILIQNKPMFKAEDFIYYNYDEYFIGTNNNTYNPINFYVCLNKKENINHVDSKYKKTIAPALHFELNKFKEEFFDILVGLFDETYQLSKDKYGINISNEIFMKENGFPGIKFYIVPCISYVNKNGIEGIMFYTNNRKFIDVNYPELCVKNFVKKDEETNYLLSTYIKMFKNIYMKFYELEDLPFDMFEVLFYNVPTELYEDLSFDNARKILEYLLNKNIKDYSTIDEQDLQFNSKYKSLSRLYAKRVIKTLLKLMSNPNHKIFDNENLQ